VLETCVGINSKNNLRLQDSDGCAVEVSGPIALDTSLALATRAFCAGSMDELFFVLTNDIRTVIEFDRASLITHISGVSRVIATNNELELNRKTEFVIKQNKFAVLLRNQTVALLLSSNIILETGPDLRIPLDLKEALKSYMVFSGYARMLLIPLTHNRALIGHLALEFSSQTSPSDAEVHSFLTLAPLMAAALAEKSLLSLRPDLAKLLHHESGVPPFKSRLKRYLPPSIIGLITVVVVFFVIPIQFTVTGEAQTVSRISHMAFCRTEGIVDKALVKDGDKVIGGELLALIDPKEVDFQIMGWKAQQDILSHEINRLVMEAGDKPASLAEKKSVELKREVARAELQFLEWKKRLLEIRSPVSGIIVTKDVHTLGGKRMRAGEVFCEIAVPEELLAQVYVPEDRISHVKVGQDVNLYLNTEPTKAYRLKVDRIAPVSEILPRIGSSYRVVAPFASPVESLKVGMKGIGKIHVADMNLWGIMVHRLATRWNQLSLYL